MPTIEADFYADWIGILRAALSAKGFPSGGSPEEVCHRFFNYLRRRIVQRPRVVEKSAEFTVVAAELAGLNLLAAKFTRGDDVMPHLSKEIANPDYHDDLLNDWGIHHLHLGTSPHSTILGLVARTGPVLFARVLAHRVLFVQVLPHNAWADRRVVDIMRANWPDVIGGKQIQGALELAQTPTDQEIKKLRKNRINTIVQTTDGAIYAPIGGGMMSTGIGLEVVRACDLWSRSIKKFEKEAVQEVDQAASKPDSVATAGTNLKVELRLQQNRLIASQDQLGYQRELGRVDW